MKRRRRYRGPYEDGGLELTSLLDVIFNLVFFFIVATTIRTEESFFEFRLPEASEGSTMSIREVIPTIGVSQEGAIALDGEVVSLPDLEARLRQLMAEENVSRAILSADANATVQQTAYAVDAIRRAGITNIIQRVQVAR